MDDLISVTLWIAGRGYRIKINPQEEEAVRLAVKYADERINELRNNYSGKDDHDFLSMCILMYATDQVTNKDSLNLSQKDLVKNMVAQIDEVILK